MLFRHPMLRKTCGDRWQKRRRAPTEDHENNETAHDTQKLSCLIGATVQRAASSVIPSSEQTWRPCNVQRNEKGRRATSPTLHQERCENNRWGSAGHTRRAAPSRKWRRTRRRLKNLLPISRPWSRRNPSRGPSGYGRHDDMGRRQAQHRLDAEAKSPMRYQPPHEQKLCQRGPKVQVPSIRNRTAFPYIKIGPLFRTP